MDFLTSEISLYIFIALGTLMLILLAWNIRLEQKMRQLMHGKDAKSLEDSFVLMRKDIHDMKHFRSELESYLKQVEKRLSRSIQGVEAINFNAFAGAESGGKSFAIAFLNQNGDGVIISSLHARDRISIFSKKIVAYKSDIELSEEENRALTEAKKSCSL